MFDYIKILNLYFYVMNIKDINLINQILND